MATTWTKDQERVINSRNRNLLVSAAAGSGKTAVLVERIVQMITDKEHPVDLDHLLVMTFTNAAAAEMRERIGRAISKKLEENPQNSRLRLQAALVPHAQIQTIDSFCLSLIRSHYACLDIDPSFRVGDEGELSLLRSDVMAELLESRYEAGEENFEHFVETYGSGKTDKGIEEVIEQMFTFSVSHPWPKQWLLACRQEFAAEQIEQIEESPWMKFLMQDIRLQISEFISQLSQALDLCQEADGPEPYLPAIRDDLEMMAYLKEAEGFPEFQHRLLSFSFGKLTAIRKKEINKEKKEEVAAIRDRIKKTIGKWKELYASQTIEEIRESILGCAPTVQMLIDLTEEFSERYQQAKKERNLVDFSDLEHYALEVLYQDEKPSLAADTLSQTYEEILVDEYQDSNYVQESLIFALSRERFGHPNVFMVGDVKQSIYRFRQARPEIFLKKYNTYKSEEGSYQKIELQKNFRSRVQVLESVNQLFYPLMQKTLGGILYTKETALYPGICFPPVSDNKREHEEEEASYKTKLLLVDAGNKELAKLDDEAKEFTSREIEVKMAVQEIQNLTDPEKGLLIWDKDEGKYRRARYGDIVILLRSLSGWAEIFVNGLMNEGIPAYAQSQAGYFQTTEVETILSLLAVIDNPIQDIPLAAVMHSPIIGMTDEELAWMMARYKQTAKKGQDRGIYGAWKLWLKQGTGKETDGQDKEKMTASAKKKQVKELENRIFQKLTGLDQMLSHFRYLAGILPIHELLEKIYQETDFYAYVSAMPAGETRQANLDLLIERAAAYESTSYQGVFHFIRYVEKLKKIETDFGEAVLAGTEEKTVRIMSIHKSKGLEFPIVILAGMGKKFNRQDAFGRLLIDAEFGIGADYFDLDMRLKSVTLKKQVLKRRLELESLGEELRILYVAMTRAREKLIMTATDLHLESKLEKYGITFDDKGQLFRVKPKTSIPFVLLSGAGSYLDWLLMALPKAKSTISCQKKAAAAFVGIEALHQMEKKTSREMLLNQPEEIIYHAEYRKQLEEALHFSYPHQEDTTLYAMMSVSELKRRSQEEETSQAMELFPKTENEKDLPKDSFGRGALRGTAYHRVLERINSWECQSFQEVVQKLGELTESGQLSREARKMVNAKTIWTFFQSDLGKRLSQAGREGRLHKEQQFMIGIPAREMNLADSDELVLVQGMIDTYAEEDDGLLLVDYKTDYVEETEELKKRYQVQIQYYIRALEQVTGKTVKEALLYSLRLQQEIRVF